MPLYTIKKNLQYIIAGKEQRVKTLQGDLICGDYVDRNITVTTIEILQDVISELKVILRDVEEQANYDSWIENPDRMGGQFTQDEIDNAKAWR